MCFLQYNASEFPVELENNTNIEQAGAELGQAQNKIGLLGELMLPSSIEVVFN